MIHFIFLNFTQASQRDIEKMEEEKLKARYNARPVTGHSAFLQKRLAKGVSNHFLKSQTTNFNIDFVCVLCDFTS